MNQNTFCEPLSLQIIERAYTIIQAVNTEQRTAASLELLKTLRAFLKENEVEWEALLDLLNQHVGIQESRNMATYYSQPLKLSEVGPSSLAHRPTELIPPQLISLYSETKLVDVIRRELRDTDELCIASAFYSRGIINILLAPFIEFTARGGKLKLLTSIMNEFNSPDDLLHLSKEIPSIAIRVFYPLDKNGRADFSSKPPAFHIKGFLFKKLNGQNTLIIGSSNLTGSGLAGNHEWNYFSNVEINIPFYAKKSAFQTAIEEYEAYWTNSSVPFDSEFIEMYRLRWAEKKHLNRLLLRASNRMLRTTTVITPRPAQEAALTALAQRRNKGITKTTVIAATGLGKTYLAAFDFKQSGMKRILFISHRENILVKASHAFSEVMGAGYSGEILSGSRKPEKRDSSVFAMIQTLSQLPVLNRFEGDEFDYMVIDEFHHAEASSYRRVLEKFRPRFLLGLTATPERMDGRDVLAICGSDVAYEIRLLDAIEQGWLVPFQYFAIHDKTDYSSVRWTGRGYIEDDLDAVLMHDTRAELAFNNLRRFLPSCGKIKALAFCSSQKHAGYMNDRFNELGKGIGMRSICLLGQNSLEERETAMQELQSENSDLQIICSVDIFGEGIDIPAVSHILFLRPTQSFTVFLQQLGRGLRHYREKEYLVALDFVGNFQQSYIAQLAVQGYTSVEEYRQIRQTRASEKKLPATCHVSVDTEVVRIWEENIRQIVNPKDSAATKCSVQVPYTAKPQYGYTQAIRLIVANDRHAGQWIHIFDKTGYNAAMDIEIGNDQNFLAWTNVAYNDISRFPARIRAAATALFMEGLRGEFRIEASNAVITITRK